MPELSYTPNPKEMFTGSRGFDCECSGAGGLAGVGSPEGVVAANPGQTYLDTSTNSFWVKNNGTGTSGWFQEIA
jgi:hypothetical protein